MMKLACFVAPHIGGTFTVYRELREGLAPHGVILQWLAAGPAAHSACHDPKWRTERDHGRVVGSADETDEHTRAMALVRAIGTGDYDGVIVNVLTSRAEMSVARYLPAHVLRVMVVHNITPGTYAAARGLREHVHATVGVSPRISDDLVRHHGFAAERCRTICNALSLAGYEETETIRAGRASRGDAGGLRLLYLGRVEDAAKGVFWLPRLLDRLDATITLTVAGDGPDLGELRRRFARHGARVGFLGAVQPAQIPSLLANHDVLIAPSRFEGFGMILAEAMAAGCVPVASRIRGVTDEVIEDGSSGLLFPVGDIRQAAAAVQCLADPSLRRRLAVAARARASEQFSASVMATRYLEVLAAIRAVPPTIAPPLDPTLIRVPSGQRSGLRTALPAPIKNMLRTMRERFA